MKNIIPQCLDFVYPIIHEYDDDKYRYSMHGTCFICSYGQELFIITAQHCLDNCNLQPKNFFIPVASNYRISLSLKDSFEIKEENNQNSFRTDICVIGINKSDHPQNEIDSLKVLDISKNILQNSIFESNIEDVWMRGFPEENPEHFIDYDRRKITVQGYITNGFIKSRKDNLQNCTYIKMKTPLPPKLTEARGMSGAPIYAIQLNKQIVFGGMVIGFNDLTNEYQIIDANFISEVIGKIIENEKSKYYNFLNLDLNLKYHSSKETLHNKSSE